MRLTTNLYDEFLGDYKLSTIYLEPIKEYETALITPMKIIPFQWYKTQYNAKKEHERLSKIDLPLLVKLANKNKNNKTFFEFKKEVIK